MPGTILEDRSPVTRGAMVDKCEEVLNAGGTVYLGENHTEANGRQTCIDVLQRRCVQHLCLEFDTSEDEFIHQQPQVLEIAEKAIGHRPPITMTPILQACTTSGASFHLVDNQTLTSNLRQVHIANQVKLYRNQITMVGRGVLVLIGSDHLLDLTTGRDRWTALPKLVYDGVTFMHGVYGSCFMMWQLS